MSYVNWVIQEGYVNLVIFLILEIKEVIVFQPNSNAKVAPSKKY